ncbi:MAG: family 16 glycosylhydrolase [Paludibacter sp.]|nr:family 16 glycosylhydrolase [Paludibacter sp.]
MKKNTPFTILLLFVTATCFTQNFLDPETPFLVQPANTNIGSDWVLNFSDEFNGNSVDLNKWSVDDSKKTRTPRPKISIDKWFWRPENVEIKEGNLVLKVKKENSTTMHCGSINSEGKYMTQYGYFEARIKIADATKGTHTAFWLQGPNMGNVNGNGNDGAEIDIFESAWTGEHTSSVIHIDGYGDGANSSTKQYQTPGIHNGFHTWGMWWTKEFIKIYYDGVLKVTYDNKTFIPWCEEYLWLSDGASFGVQGDSFFVNRPVGWLTEAYVDYIRVWKAKGDIPVTSSNLLVNGDFNNDGNSWTASNSDLVYDNAASTEITGRTCRLSGAGSDRFIKQTINVIPGRTYQFSLKGRIQNEIGASGAFANNHATNGAATLKGEILISGNETLLALSTQKAITQNLFGTFTVPEDVTSLTVRLSKDWNIAYVDDVVVEEVQGTSATNFPNQNKLKISTFNNNLKIEATSLIRSLLIYDVSGSLVAQHVPMNINASVEIILPGVYIVKALLSDGEICRKKFIIR